MDLRTRFGMIAQEYDERTCIIVVEVLIKEIDFDSVHHQRIKGSKLYLFEGCLNCLYEYKCREKIKDRTIDYRKYELSLKEQIYREQVKENLLSIKGIEIRINRSIQVEGTFGDLKQNLNYIRFRRKLP